MFAMFGLSLDTQAESPYLTPSRHRQEVVTVYVEKTVVVVEARHRCETIVYPTVIYPQPRFRVVNWQPLYRPWIRR